MYKLILASMHVHIHIHIHVHAHLHVPHMLHLHLYMYIYMYIYIYNIHAYTYTQVHAYAQSRNAPSRILLVSVCAHALPAAYPCINMPRCDGSAHMHLYSLIYAHLPVCGTTYAHQQSPMDTYAYMPTGRQPGMCMHTYTCIHIPGCADASVYVGWTHGSLHACTDSGLTCAHTQSSAKGWVNSTEGYIYVDIKLENIHVDVGIHLCLLVYLCSANMCVCACV